MSLHIQIHMKIKPGTPLAWAIYPVIPKPCCNQLKVLMHLQTQIMLLHLFGAPETLCRDTLYIMETANRQTYYLTVQ